MITFYVLSFLSEYKYRDLSQSQSSALGARPRGGDKGTYRGQTNAGEAMACRAQQTSEKSPGGSLLFVSVPALGGAREGAPRVPAGHRMSLHLQVHSSSKPPEAATCPSQSLPGRRGPGAPELQPLASHSTELSFFKTMGEEVCVCTCTCVCVYKYIKI